MRITRAVAVLALVLTAAACKDSPTNPLTEDLVGKLSFSYSGYLSGSYNAEGKIEIDATGNVKPADFAAAAYEPSPTNAADSTLAIFSADVDANQTADVLAVWFAKKPKTGEFPLNSSECFFSSTPDKCPFAGVDFNIPVEDTSYVSPVNYDFTSGTLSLTRVDSKVVEGTFSGTVEVSDAKTGAVLGTIQVTNGSFRTPVFKIPTSGFNLSQTPLTPPSFLRGISEQIQRAAILRLGF